MAENDTKESYWKDPELIADLKEICDDIATWPKWMQRYRPKVERVSTYQHHDTPQPSSEVPPVLEN